MNTNQSREEILSRINAVSDLGISSILNTAFKNEDIYKPISPDAISCFKEELEAISGECIICNDQNDMLRHLKAFVAEKNFAKLFCRDNAIGEMLLKNGVECTNRESDFEDMQVGVTDCEFLIARTGSVLVTSAGTSGRQMNVFPPVHIIIAHVNQLLHYPEDALKAIAEKYNKQLPSTITTITGPSRTADIEKTLVLGAHGPKELVVFLMRI